MMGLPGLMRATQIAILAANYVATRLREHYRCSYSGATAWWVARVHPRSPADHQGDGVSVDDVAKRA